MICKRESLLLLLPSLFFLLSFILLCILLVLLILWLKNLHYVMFLAAEHVSILSPFLFVIFIFIRLGNFSSFNSRMVTWRFPFMHLQFLLYLLLLSWTRFLLLSKQFIVIFVILLFTTGVPRDVLPYKASRRDEMFVRRVGVCRSSVIVTLFTSLSSGSKKHFGCTEAALVLREAGEGN